MDLTLWVRILWRFKLVAALGFVLAVGLAILTVAKVELRGAGLPKLVARQQPSYQSDATLLITDPNFPWGRTYQPYVYQGPKLPPSPSGDPTRLTNFAALYIELANSDQVRALALRKAHVAGTFSAA